MENKTKEEKARAHHTESCLVREGGLTGLRGRRGCGMLTEMMGGGKEVRT